MKGKLFILALAVITLLSVSVAAVGCKTPSVEAKAEFVSGVKKEIYISDIIDFDDYIKKVDGTTYSLTVEYYNLISGKTVTEKFSGNNMVFYPKMVGEHTITYEVKSGQDVKSAQMRISVKSNPPTITISHTAQIINMPETGSVTRSLEYLMSNAAITLNPLSAPTHIVSVASRKLEVGLNKEAPQWVETNIGEDDETFTFNDIGEYQFFVRATVDNVYAEDYFLVTVIKDPSGGTSKSDGTAVIETAKGVVFDEDDPYTFKIMSSPLDDINYVVVADKLGDGKKLSLIFKGKNFPQLGFYVIPDETSKIPYNIYTTKGGFFSFVAKEASGHKWVFFLPNMLTGSAARTPIPGKNDFGVNDFEDDKYYLMQYSLTTDRYFEEREAWRLKVNVEIFPVISYTTADENSACVIGDRLHEIGAEGQFYFLAGGAAGFDFSKGSSVIYGDIRNNIDIQYISDESNITFAGSEPIIPEPIEEPDLETVILSAAEITEIKSGTTVIGFSGSYDYAGLGAYKVGDVLEFHFTGQSIPNVALFTNKNGVNPVGGGTENTGIFLQTSGHGTQTFNKRLYISGPFLLDAGSVEPYRTIPGREDYSYRGELGKNIEYGVDISNPGNTSLFGIDMLDSSTNYVYRVWTTASDTEGKVVIHAALYSVVDTTRTEITVYTREITHYLDTLEGRYAVVYGTGSYSNKTISVSYVVNPDG